METTDVAHVMSCQVKCVSCSVPFERMYIWIPLRNVSGVIELLYPFLRDFQYNSAMFGLVKK